MSGTADSSANPLFRRLGVTGGGSSHFTSMRQAGRSAAFLYVKLAVGGDSSGPGRRLPTGVVELSQGGWTPTTRWIIDRTAHPRMGKTALDAAPEFAGLR